MAEETLDYLGRPAALSIAEKPALPVGAFPAATAGPSAPSGIGVAAGGAAGDPFGTGGETGFQEIGGAGPGTVTTDPGGAPGVPGDPTGPVMSRIARDVSEANPELAKLLMAAPEAAGKVMQALERLGLFGGGGEVPTISAEGLSLSGESPDSVLNPAGFSLEAGSLDTMLPDLLSLQGFFDGAGGSALNPSDFSLFGDGGGSVLNPADYSLGVDTSFQAPDGGGFSGPGDAVGGIASTVAKLIGMFGTDSPAIKAILAGIGPLISPLVGAAVNAATTGASFAQGAAAGLGGGAFTAAWNLPQLADTISKIAEGDTQIKRHFERAKDASGLQGDILGPLSKARTPEEFVGALGSPVGGVRVGDALASILRNNLAGTWYTDTAHNWMPDVSLIPFYEMLTSLGYSGTSEPTLRNVGGVGEIVAGAGKALIPGSAYGRGGPFYEGDISDEGGQRTNAGSWGSWGPGGTNAEQFNDASMGSLGWESVLRQIAGTQGAPSLVAPALIHQGGVRDTSSEGGGYVNPGTGAAVPLETGIDPAYLEALRAFSPETAERIDQAAQQRIDNYYLNQQGGNG